MREVGPNGQPLLTSNPADEPEACRWCGLPSDMVVPVIEPAEVQDIEMPKAASGENVALCDDCHDLRLSGSAWGNDAIDSALHDICEELEIDGNLAPEVRARHAIERIKRMREDLQEARIR